MLGTPFGYDLIRKYVIAFGTLFNNVKLQRLDPDTNTTQWISVPLSYGPKEKWQARLADPDLNQQIQVSLPRMSYEMITMTYAPDRKLGTLNRHSIVTADSNINITMYEAVPYDFQFALHLYARNAADASRIIEQILPFFTPEFTVTLNDVTDHHIDIDVPITIDGINKDDVYEGDFESTRFIIWTLDFTVKGRLYGPTQNAKPIKRAFIDFFIPNSFVAYHKGTTDRPSSNGAIVWLQANTSTRESSIYSGGSITITGEGSGTTGIAGNTRTILSHDGDSQSVLVTSPFSDSPTEEWTYTIQYRTERTDEINADQLPGLPTASRIYTTPGLTINGDPTTNSSLTISENLIDAEDDYGIIQTVTFFPDSILAGTRRDLTTGIDEDI